MSELFQGGFSFSVHMFASKDKNAKFFSFKIKGIFICVIHFMNSKRKNLPFPSLQANRGSENKSPPLQWF